MKHFIGRLCRFASDGSDFVLGSDDGSTKRVFGRLNALKTCLKFNYNPAEKKLYEKILADELVKNSLFREGWEFARQNLHKKDKSLEENEFLAVFTYTYKTLPVYSEFNKKTRELGPEDSRYDFKAMYYFLSAAMHDISQKTLQNKPYQVYRGVTHPVTAEVGQQFHFNCFTSTSTDQSIAETFLTNKGENGSKTLFIIETYQGEKIDKFSAFPEEKEVLISPCEMFEVVKIFDRDSGIKKVQLNSLGMTA